jgi:hypothetical protein
LQEKPWKDLELQRNVLRPRILTTQSPDGRGELAAGDVGSGQANKWVWTAIGLTLDLLVATARPEVSPVSGDGGAVALRPRPLEFRRGSEWSGSKCCGVRS